MPCDSSYLRPTAREAGSHTVLTLLHEVGEEPAPDYYARVETLDADTARLCAWCRTHDVAAQSLELQIWWRDHQAADAAKAAKAIRAGLDTRARERALSKLTPKERALLKL